MKKFFALPALSVFIILLCSTVSAQTHEQSTANGTQQLDMTPQQIFQVVLKAAEGGNAQAMLTLGTLYEKGVGNPRNFSLAMDWYSKAAEAGLAEGLYNTAVCYEVGIGVRSDPAKAIEFFKKAAEKDMPQALYKLATIYMNGVGVSADTAKGLQYLNKAVDVGHPVASNDLGVIYLQGLSGVDKDEKKALDLLIKSAGLGNGEAMKNIAVIFKDGIGVKADTVMALKWYLLAQKAGFQSAEIDGVIKEVKQGMNEADVRKAENAAEHWILERQKEQEKANGKPASDN